MLIREIKPIGDRGMNFITMDASESYIDRMIELPLRNACKIFKAKGIETVMSSANQNNILKPGEAPFEREDLLKLQEPSVRPSYEMAGRGYAWIMLNFETLSEENKNWLFLLQDRNNGQKAVWFVHPYNIPKHLQKSEEFEKRCMLISYHDGFYPRNSVFLRMPITEESTVEEVDSYFSKLAESFKEQKQEKKKGTLDFWEL